MKKIITLLSISVPLTAVADNARIDAFMTAFHANPQKVMDALPEKEGDEYQTISAEELERFRDQMRETVMERAEPVIAPRFSANLNNDNPARLVDVGNALIRNLVELDSAAPDSKYLDVQPWSDTYWPLYSGAAAWRYSDRELYASDWQEYYDFSHTIKPLDSYSSEQRHLLSPAEKYDLLVGDKNFTLTKRSWDSGKGYYESQGKVERWMGLCHGWAAAAYMLPRPEKSIIVPDANGEMLKFYPSDVKALGTLLWAEAPFNTRFIGGRCNIQNPEKDENGRVIEPDCVDNNPASWHLSVLNQIGITGRSMIMDATYDYQVWNQPILGYQVKYFNPETNRSSGNPADVTIAMADYKKDKFTQYRASRAVSVVGVQMVVDYMVETNPTHRNYDKPKLDGVSRVTYYYDLELDAQGNVIGGEWYQNRHPDFLWTPTPEAVAKSYYDGSGEWDVTQSVPQSWQDRAPKASRYTQPMTSVVSALFSAASGDEKPAEQWKQIATQGSQCLDVEGSSATPGARVYGWSCHSGDNQLWQLTTEGKMISKVAPGLCLDQQGSSITMETCSQRPNQTWRMENGQLKNSLDNALRWNSNSWLVQADVNGSQWSWK
ncbi:MULTISPECIES: ricin-type beta-trefoil lectin domain protein [Vibrio]|uniref:ricin-type beta-trefoil lectin domain protein n=1 Tax=Vibrio TaxID=662 RepID=UPI000C16E057|nr:MULTISPECIES: ricin-type beta-trefoil lectin domain protein [Vibrio]NRF61555.1 ricin-type beta-trefoil lectin domain protein [Vibrio coralliilyticus]QFT35867.1 Extracellular exo-alpha-L-arabinofuranosidase precursor [Vibrio sp. THAF64]QGM33767.1 Extracellular exo-alpha-L-arabinofuranosidase precursor [Vibrio sp. THAF191d]QGN69270.1 Extracellular exo-alpha-L-arabinofuranosidase precursor [Vibrio sp. THAF191c]